MRGRNIIIISQCLVCFVNVVFFNDLQLLNDEVSGFIIPIYL